MISLHRAFCVAAVTLFSLAGSLCTASAQVAEDSALEQKLDRGQQVATGQKVLSAGHIDVGPRFDRDEWTLMIHDDTARPRGGESVWRHLEQTVIRVGDRAQLRVPDDSAYEFLPVSAGAEVFVIPQTQKSSVVWVGWNTQDPTVMDTVDRGATLQLAEVQGPGELVVYLQSGAFEKPDVLWDSTESLKPVWVDVNTHAHANWVFSKAGNYLVRVRVAAELIDGTEVSDTRELRFSVGSESSPNEAFDIGWTDASSNRPRHPADSHPGSAGAREGSGFPVAIALLVLAALGLATAAGGAMLRGRRAKALAFASRDRDDKQMEDEA